MRNAMVQLSLVLLTLSSAAPARAQSIAQSDIERFDLSLVDPPQFVFAVISDTHVTAKRAASAAAKMVDPGLKSQAFGPYNNQFSRYAAAAQRTRCPGL